MAEYIDREAFMENVRLKYCKDCTSYNGLRCGSCWVDDMEDAIEDAPTADVVEIPKSGIGDLSDGYHTFNELYHNRAILFSVICNSNPDKAWKSKLHDTGDMYDGMFIVGIETPQGQATYHYDINPYWDMFKVRELEKAPKWDGHTPKDAIERISVLKADVAEVRHGEWKHAGDDDWRCTNCNDYFRLDVDMHPIDDCGMNYCPNCGAKMDGKDGAENG